MQCEFHLIITVNIGRFDEYSKLIINLYTFRISILIIYYVSISLSELDL